MSLINTQIKPFKATAYHNGKFVPVSDTDLKGKWSVVFFYPADFTFVCPTELGDIADNYETFKSMGVEIYSVSTDTHFTHKAWHDTSETIAKIQYPMIGDPTGACKLHNMWQPIQVKFAPPSGPRVRRPWLRRWTWSARSKLQALDSHRLHIPSGMCGHQNVRHQQLTAAGRFDDRIYRNY
jgi:peroxiredoxin